MDVKIKLRPKNIYSKIVLSDVVVVIHRDLDSHDVNI